MDIRKDFQCLGGGKVYLDSACMSLKPKQVVEAMNEYFEKWPACGGRSAHEWGDMVTKRYEEARKTIAKFVGASANEIVFTKNSSESLNLLAYALDLKKGDIVLTTDREHNSNLLPWLFLKERKGIVHKVIPSNKDETFNLDKFSETVKGAKLVSVVHSSNLDGYTLPVEEIIKIAHDAGAIVILDGAQSVPHHPVNVKKLGVDFLVFSGHKMLGPSIGVLYGKKDLLDKISPFMLGGETVESSTYDSYKLLKSPEKFEAGLQNYAGAIGPQLAELLGIPVATYVKKIELEGNKLKVERGLGSTTEEVELELPVVVTVTKEINEPRIPSLRGMMRAKKTEIVFWGVGDIQADPKSLGLDGSPTQVIKIFTPPPRKGGQIFQGDTPEVADRLVGLLKEEV